MTKNTLFAALFAVSLSSSLSSSARADEVPPADADGGRSTEFRAMTGPAQESVPGGMLLVSAYAVVWVVVFGYVLRLGGLSAATRTKLERLEQALSKGGSGDA